MKVLCIGHSHMAAAQYAYQNGKSGGLYQDLSWSFIQLQELVVRELIPAGFSEGDLHDRQSLKLHPKFIEAIEKSVAELGGQPDYVFIWIGGSHQHTMSLVRNKLPFEVVLPGEEDLPLEAGAEILPYQQVKELLRQQSFWKLSLMKALKHHFQVPVLQREAPPPIEDEAHIRAYPGGAFQDLIVENGISPAPFRYKIWRIHSSNYQDMCKEAGVIFLPVPHDAVFKGYLLNDYYQNDSIHANVAYGHLLIREMLEVMRGGVDGTSLVARKPVGTHPYSKLPDASYWKRSVAGVPPTEVDPVGIVKFKIKPADRVATAGSCFAQHIARHLTGAGFNYFVTEPGHPMMPPDLKQTYGYGVFSARFGNIYTTRQLVQLVSRAYGDFSPDDHVWEDSEGKFYDPFRPTVNPLGYPSREEFDRDQAQHFSAIRRMFEELDIFVFTLGLTECWKSTVDGAVYPVCPGTAAGTFDPGKHEFVNLTADEILADIDQFVAALRTINPGAKILLTVSPVPLVATAESRHVLVSTTVSKSVLRVAADMAVRKYEHIDYFPSYEIICGAFNRGNYFAKDLRSITEAGVSHVMRLFLSHYGSVDAPPEPPPEPAIAPQADQFKKMQEAIRVMCDEEVLNGSH